MNKETEIQNYMTKLGISREEAEQLWEDDNSDEVLPEVAEMEKKAKANGRRYEQTAKKKSAPKERKVDTDKLTLFEIIMGSLEEVVSNGKLKTETEYNFNYKGNNYTFKLTKHKKK